MTIADDHINIPEWRKGGALGANCPQTETAYAETMRKPCGFIWDIMLIRYNYILYTIYGILCRKSWKNYAETNMWYISCNKKHWKSNAEIIRTKKTVEKNMRKKHDVRCNKTLTKTMRKLSGYRKPLKTLCGKKREISASTKTPTTNMQKFSG